MSLLSTLLVAGSTACADKAGTRQRGNQWTLRTSRMESVIALEDGRLVLERFTDRTTGREMVAGGAVIEKFPQDPMIRYNLACYECQLGRLQQAKSWLEEAFEVGDPKKIRLMASEDPDLEPLWREIEKT